MKKFNLMDKIKKIVAEFSKEVTKQEKELILSMFDPSIEIEVTTDLEKWRPYDLPED